jgi:cytochrome P450
MTVDLYDPDAYVGAPPHAVLAELRRSDPVHFQEMSGEPGYWMVLKHADVVHVAREPNLFSASEGGVVLENLGAEQLEMMRNMLLAMDPPRHGDYRRPIADRFKARVIANMEPQIREICGEIMAVAAEQRDVEFVHDVTSALPSRVIGRLMGLPEADLPMIHRLAEMNTSGQDADFTSDVSQGTIDMAMYAIQFAAARRQEAPREDLTTLLLETDFSGHYMTDIDFGSFFVQLVTAGNDTTKTMLSSGLRVLLDHPEQLADLRADHSLVPGAVEEILRYENPLHYFRRTATADTMLRGTTIASGDKVVMFYTSANRDEDVFDHPQTFDIRRSPNPHLSFGIAEHFCLGVHLARLEGKVFFEELLSTFPGIEFTGDPVRIRSNLNNGLKSLPVRLTKSGAR